MQIETRSLKFNDVTIIFAFFKGAGWILPAKLLGKALGYTNEGQTLADLITSNWSKEPGWNQGKADSFVYDGEALAALKETGKYNVSFMANSALFLTIDGVIKVLTRSRAKLARDFREYLARNGGDLLPDELRGKLPAKKTVRKTAKKASQETPLLNSNTLDDIYKTVAQMSKYGLLTKAEQKTVLSRVLESQIVKLQKELGVTHFLESSSASLAPIVGMDKTTLATAQGNVRLIEGRMKHPDFQDWIPALEIAELTGGRYNKDTIKKFISQYVASQGSDLPNNDASRWVANNGGKFPPTDEHGFIKYVNPKLGGMSMYIRQPDNKLLWRNYWSPEAVRSILNLIPSLRNGELPFLSHGDPAPESRTLNK